MTRYLISFPSSAMDHIPEEDIPAVGEAAHAVVQEAMDAGVWIFGGGLAEDVDPVMVAADGTTTVGTYPQTKDFNGGFAVLDVPSREAALQWAAKIATACGCAQLSVGSAYAAELSAAISRWPASLLSACSSI